MVATVATITNANTDPKIRLNICFSVKASIGFLAVCLAVLVPMLVHTALKQFKILGV